jgi:hypothetical protein
MAKFACIFGLIVALALLVVFSLDVAMGIPFLGSNKVMDYGFIAASVFLAYISFATFRELP